MIDQRNNIGALVVRRCRAKGVDVGRPPGKAMRQARNMFPGTAKTDPHRRRGDRLRGRRAISRSYLLDKTTVSYGIARRG